MECWRLFRVDKNQMPRVLFHGFPLNGKRTRTIPLDKWIQAEEKPVYNPGKYAVGTQFISGWHVLPTREILEAYTKRFAHPEELYICRVFVKNVYPKPKSKVLLARWQLVKTIDWNNALNIII